jgi:hydroxyethylthiazole kinase
MRVPAGTICGIVHAPHDERLLTRLPGGIGSAMCLPAQAAGRCGGPTARPSARIRPPPRLFDGRPAVASAEEMLDRFWREGSARRQDPVLRDDVLAAGPAWLEGEAACPTALSAAVRAAGRGAGDPEGFGRRPRAGVAAGRGRLGASDLVLKAIDLVRTRSETWRMDVGVPALRRVVGGGCLASAFVGAALGAGLEPGPAGLAPLALLDLAGERAAVDAAGPGTFQARWLDVLAEGEAVLEAVK